jgi:hypothetical protein
MSKCIPTLIKVGRRGSQSIHFCPLSQIKVGSFCLVLLSDVLGVEVFLLAPTVSGGDGDGPRFCTSLPPSPTSFPPRFLGIALKTLDEFP